MPLAHEVRRAYPGSEWAALTRLPCAVAVAVTSAEPASPRQRVAEGLAGLDAIAAGRLSDSDLVRAVAAAIYAESAECVATDVSAGSAECVATDVSAGSAECVATDVSAGSVATVGPVADDPWPTGRGGGAGAAGVLDECRRVAALLAVRADPADSAAYRQWVQRVAARVCGAAGRSPPVSNVGASFPIGVRPAGDGPVAGPPRISGGDLLADLGDALGLR